MDISTCLAAVSPLQLPIRDNPVSLEGVGSVRGIPVTLSQPGQFFSMKPAITQNNTFVYNHCAASNYSCIAEHGGVYSPPTDVTRSNSYNGWNGTTGSDVQGGSYVFYNDLMTIEGRKIPGFPFFTYQQAADSFAIQPGLGLGPDSAFLRAASDLDLIPNKQCAYWGGDADAEIDGHLIIGGYDRNRVDGDFTTFDTDVLKGLGIYITDISWVTTAGNTTSLMENTEYSRLVASIEPFVDFIQLPQSVKYNFELVTDATSDPATQLVSYQSRPSGSLDITLSNDMVISLAAQDIFDHGLSYDSEGNANTSTYDFWTPRVYTEFDYPTYTLAFGTPFLKRLYLVTDFAGGKFHLANAVSGTRSSVSIQPLCTGGPSPTPDPVTVKKTNVGAIAGGVAGGVGGLVLIGAILFFVLRRRKQRKPEANVTTMDDKVSQPHSPHPPPQYVSGVPSPGPVFAEKDGVATSAQPLSPTSTVPSAAPPSMGELPSPRSDVSRSSQGYPHQHEKVSSNLPIQAPDTQMLLFTRHSHETNDEQLPHALIEMPAERY